MKRIAITGAGGFIGRALTARLRAKAYACVALSREPATLRLPEDVECRRFDANDPDGNPTAFERIDAVIHLAGENVAGRWTARKKHAIFASRVDGTRAVVDSMARLATRPAVLIASSATGYYGARGDATLDETSAPGDDFLARTCIEWEREARRAAELGIRSVQIRTGIVLGDGGALRKMAAPFRFGAGGPFGSGRQFVPWIHLDDLVELYVFALERETLTGAVNGVTPDYATSARFAQALGAALHRPAIIPAPAPALRLVLGEFAQTLLGSTLVIPATAQDAGFAWRHPELEGALAAVYPSSRAWPVVRHFRAEQFLPVPLEAVYAFFSDASNLEAVTPASLRFAMREHPAALERGAQIAYELRVHGLPLRWRTMIARWKPPFGFDDVQLHGPYALWHHAHTFERVAGGVLVKDHVRYALPLYPFGNLAAPLVAADVRKIFAYRRTALERWAAASGTELRAAR
ncbi:MAG: TIGR01777 family oxidoreductase [Candidatus Velthaea sp.]